MAESKITKVMKEFKAGDLKLWQLLFLNRKKQRKWQRAG